MVKDLLSLNFILLHYKLSVTHKLVACESLQVQSHIIFFQCLSAYLMEETTAFNTVVIGKIIVTASKEFERRHLLRQYIVDTFLFKVQQENGFALCSLLAVF